MQTHNLSTQTDFTPRISQSVFHKLNNIRLESPDPEMQLSNLQKRIEEQQWSSLVAMTSLKENVQKRFADFKSLAMAKPKLINISANNINDILKLLTMYRNNNLLPKGAEIRESVLFCANESSAQYSDNFTMGIKQNQRCCSSQTEISTLLVWPHFGKLKAKDNVKTKISKMHGTFIFKSLEYAKLQTYPSRLKQYCKDLNEGKEILVSVSDLSDEMHAEILAIPHINMKTADKSTENFACRGYDKIHQRNDPQSKTIGDMQLIHHEIFAQLEGKVKSTLNFEIETAIKKSTESFKNLQLACNCSNRTARIDELQRMLSSKDNLLAEAERKLRNETSDKNSANSKLKESHRQLKEKESEISKLSTKISNQNKTNSQQQQAMNLKCKEIEKLKEELNKISSQQSSQVEVNRMKTKITQLEADVRRYKNASSSVSHLEAELHKYKSIAGMVGHLKTQLAEEKKKTKDSGAGDKPLSVINSEQEILLIEKDAIIAEYISGSDS